jgi:integrase
LKEALVTKRKPNTISRRAQATGAVLLSTAADDLGIVPANKAASEAARTAQQTGEPVYLRDPTTDKVLGIAEVSGALSPAKPDRLPRKSPPRRCKLTDLSVRKLKPGPAALVIWDLDTRGLAVRVQPSGRKAWYVVYSRHGRARWLHLGPADAIALGDARTLAKEAILAVAKGGDPAADKKAERSQGTFAELHASYLEQHAKRKNKSWAQADALIRRNALPLWGGRKASVITRSDIKQMMRGIEAPIAANQTLAAVSAVFTWGVREELVAVNPCKLVERNPTTSRERVLSASELPQFWQAFADAGVEGAALKMILLSGQRPGEVAHMRREHLVDGWWQLPGAPVADIWPGTKNAESHRVWIPLAARKLIVDGGSTGYVFAGSRGRPVSGLDVAMRAIRAKLGVERATPHDLRRTHGSTVTALGFGRDAMNRIQNHREGGIASVYDRHGYAEENMRVMEAVASRLMALAEERPDDNVITMRQHGRAV